MFPVVDYDHSAVLKYSIIGSDKGLEQAKRQAIVWTIGRVPV